MTRKAIILIICLILGGWTCTPAIAQDVPPQAAQAAPAQPVNLAVTFPEDTTVKVLLRGTERLPGATGEAKIKRKPGITEVEVKLKGMKPAISFGGDFNTYVLWTVAPEGAAVNVGEFFLKGNESRLSVTTPLMTFALFVTAEPHFLAQKPSGFFVLENTDEGLVRQTGVTTMPFEYDAASAGYKYNHTTLATAPLTKGEIRTERYQALIALRLAEQAGAKQYAPAEYAQAQSVLSSTQQGFTRGIDDKYVAVLSHRVIRLAVRAKQLAEERAAQAALDSERQNWNQTVDRLTRARENADAAASRAREEARQAEEAAQKAKAEVKRAEDSMLHASERADQLARQKLEAEKQAASAQKQAAVLYARLETALSRVAETRETSRGLMVNLPDILFDSGKSTLRSGAREILSRIAGILLVAPEYRISIEGYTDSTGRSDLNQKLSEDRAQSVRDYLVEAQISPALITTRGLGESNPVASNRTAAGRQQNRRVEIIIEGLTREGF